PTRGVFALGGGAPPFLPPPPPFVFSARPSFPAAPRAAAPRHSFYSGHTSASFAMAVTAGMLSHYHGYSNEGWVWATGLTLAATTGVLRIAADKHYSLDVVSGAAAGAAVSLLTVRLHRPEGAPAAPIRTPPLPTSAAVSVPIRIPSLGGHGALSAGLGSGAKLEVSWRW